MPKLLLAQAISVAPAEQYLLLKNDRVMVGQVAPRGDNFLVEIAESAHVFIPKDQVLFVGTSLQDLYQYKLRGMIKPNTGDHFKLTRWCMANGMLDEAVTHYKQVSQAAGDHPRVKQLAVELKDQLLKDAEFRAYLGLAPLPRPGESPVRTVAATSGTDDSSTTVMPAGGMRPPPAPEVVARFSERVQPILLNRCSQAACHGGQTKTPLKLMEPHPRFGTKTSADNLRNVLAYISADDQQVSPLIDYATRAHGLRRIPSIDITETQLMQELRDWIELVKNPVVSADGLAGGTAFRGGRAVAREAALSPVTRGSEPRPVPDSARSATLDQWRGSGTQPVPVGIAIPNPDGSPAGSPPSGVPSGVGPESGPPGALRGAAEPSIMLPGDRTTADPFDPSAFNQRARSGTTLDTQGFLPSGG